MVDGCKGGRFCIGPVGTLNLSIWNKNAFVLLCVTLIIVSLWKIVTLTNSWLSFKANCADCSLGTPHRHIACLKCMRLRERLIPWGENPMLVQELDLCLLHTRHSSQLHTWRRDLWGWRYSCKFSFLFFFPTCPPKNSILLSWLICSRHKHTTYLQQQHLKILSRVLDECECFYKHKAFHGCNEFLLPANLDLAYVSNILMKDYLWV